MKLFVLLGLAAGIGLLPLGASGDENLTINVILPLTGPAAFVGQDEKAAIQIYETMINKAGGAGGRALHLQILDDQSSPQVDLQLVNGIMQQHAAAFLGPALNAGCSAVEPLVRSSGPVDYCLSPALSPKSGSFVFASGQTLATMDFAFARFMLDKRYRRVAQLISTDASGQNGARSFADGLAKYPALQLVDAESFDPSAITIAAQVAKIKALNPQCILLNASGPAFGTALRSLYDAGMVNVPVFTSSANLTKAQLAQDAAFLPRALYFDGFAWQGGEPRDPAMRKRYVAFVTGFKNAGIVPTSTSAYAWDPVTIIVSAFGRLGPDATADQIRNYIANLHDFAGINGSYDFGHGDQHGLVNSTVLLKWSPSLSDAVAASKPGGKPL
jgi:branched-chain amino acid transport system substrate-binding protein